MMNSVRPILVTGGAGFIGSNFVLDWIANNSQPIVNLDALTYAGNLQNLQSIATDQRHVFVKGDIADRDCVEELLAKYRPVAVVHFAAESHVDRSILGPGEFIRTNILGTYNLLEAQKVYWNSLSRSDQATFRFLHISTDEVYGSLAPDGAPFTEGTPYAPSSPYSASKAAADHLVRAYHHTYGLPTLTTNCSNNYGPFQFPEKLIPLTVLNALQGKPLPIYGDGRNVRDWLFVTDHCRALRRVLAAGVAGQCYNIGGSNEQTNLEVVNLLCTILDEVHPEGAPHCSLITYVKDRPGHDLRYAVDCAKIQSELGWTPTEVFETGLRKTVAWYIENIAWVENVISGAYREWIQRQYASA